MNTSARQPFSNFLVNLTLTVAFLLGLANTALSQTNVCPNSNFSEGNFNNWSGCWGLWCAPDGGSRCSGSYIPFKPPCDNLGQTWTNTPNGGHFAITSNTTQRDPYVNEIFTVFPGDQSSALLGFRHIVQGNNNGGGGYADQLKYQFTYHATSSFFIYRFAVVLEDITNSTHNTPDKRPRFTVEIRDHASQAPLDPTCGFFDVYPGDGQPNWNTYTIPSPINKVVQWKNWSSIGIDLSTLATPPVEGQLLDVVFTVHGCGYQAHTGYAYISTVCSQMSVSLSGCSGASSVALTGPPGFAQYEWFGPICPTCTPSVVCLGPNPDCSITNAFEGDIYRLNMVSFNGCAVNNTYTTIAFTHVLPSFTSEVNCVGNPSSFTDISTSTNPNQPIVRRKWQFDASGIWEGPFSDPTIIHTFNTAGPHEVAIESYSQDDCMETTSQTVNVELAPVITTPLLDKTICSGENVGLALDFSQASAFATWSGAVTTGSAAITLNPPGRSGNLIDDIIVNTGSDNAVVTYTIIPKIGTCEGVPVFGYVTVLPLPAATIAGTTAVCTGDPAPNITFTGSKGIPPFTFTYNINGGPSQTVTSVGASITVPAPTGTTGAFTYNLTSVQYASGVACPQTQSGNAVITVHPIPDFITSLAYSTCSGVAFSIPLTSSPAGASYSWTTPTPTCSANIFACPPGATSAALTGNLSVTDLNQGTVTYHITPAANGCSGVSKDLVVTVDPKPNITSPSSPSENLCTGGTTNIMLQSGLAGATINWQVLPGGCTNIVTCPGSGSASPISNQLTLTSNSSPGTVVYTITPNVGGCFGDAVSHTVHVLPPPVVTLTQFPQMCLTSPQITLAGWGSPAGGTFYLGGNVITTFNPGTAGAGTYPITYTYIDAYGCTSSDQKDIVVKGQITPSLTGDLTACEGVAEPYSTDAGMNPTSYSWSAVPDGTITNGANPWQVSFTWPSPGIKTITVNYLDLNGCPTSPKIETVTVGPKPNITSPSSPSENLCTGGTTNILLQSGFAGATINWQVLPGGCTNIVTCPGSGAASPISNQLTLVSNSSPGSVVYTITPSLGGCSGDAVPHTVNVLQLPPVVLTQFIPVCLNTPAFTLTGGAPTVGTYTLNGTPITTFNPATAGAGTYHIIYTYTDANGCTASDDKDLLVQSLITPNLLGNASACVGVTESFTTDPGMIPASYAWTVSPDGTKVAGANPWEVTITWNSTGTKTIGVTYTDPNGCTTTPGSKNVTVNPLPTPSLVAPDVNVCNNRSYTYTTQPGMTGGYTWVVSNPTVNVLTQSGNTASVLWNAISPAEWIRVNYVNANGCTAVAPTSYTVNVNPTPLYIVTGSGSVCAGSTSAFQLQGTEKGNWSITSGGSIITPVNNVNAISVSWASGTILSSSSINVTYTNSLGCAGTTNTNVDIQPLPITTFTSSTPSPVCQDYPTPSLYSMDAGGAPATYLWQVSPASMAVMADATANPAAITWKLTGTTPQTAQLSVTATTSATTPACSATSSPVTITINPKPNSLMTPCFDLMTSRSAKRFMLKGGTPLLTATPLQGEYLISPATTALSFDGTNYWFDPSLVSGNLPTTFDISYKYTSARYGCPATSTPVILSVLGLNPTCGSTLTDPRDGISYRTSSSLVPGKCWMLENLRYGQSPPTSTSPQTDNCIVERNCLSSDPTCIAYGGLYQWDELIQYGMTDGPAYQGVCPPGWHIPSSAEWTDLIDAVVNLPGVSGNGLAGSYLKDKNLSNGFDALLTGIYYFDNVLSYNTGYLIGTMYWTSTHDASYPERVVTRGVNNINYSVSNYPASRANAFPVRCVKD